MIPKGQAPLKLAAQTVPHIMSAFLLTVLLARGPGVVAPFSLKLHGASPGFSSCSIAGRQAWAVTQM